ncbi:MAG: CoA pyrophosphatase [Ketobacteraceae bacterium]|nr:CoA pyrophosphatase [Ketobacteraceae bacterium]
MLDRVRERLQEFNRPPPVNQQPEAAVLIPITDQPLPELVLTRRAQHLSSHAGEVAFPGGKRDPEDADLVETALRETHEEIALPPQAVEVLGHMPPARSKFGLLVTPFVGVFDPSLPLIPNEDELDHIFSVPLQYFIDNEPTGIHQAEYDGRIFDVPCYNYKGNVIWGLTAYFIAQFVNHAFDTEINIKLRSNTLGSEHNRQQSNSSRRDL